MSPMRVVVIGAGAGGLTAAAHLAQRGMQVTLVEKNEAPGGRCTRVVRDGHVFDAGPTLYIMPRVFDQEFSALGESAGERLTLQQVDPTYHLVFDDNQRLNLTADREKMRLQLESMEHDSFAGFERYYEQAARHYTVAMDKIVCRNFRSLAEFISPPCLSAFLQVGALSRHYACMRSFFRSPRLKAAFTFQDMYMGLSPFEAPSTFSMMQYTELAHGVWYPKGGMYTVVEALQSIAIANGVEVRLGTPVEQILTRHGRATGVLLADGSQLPAEIVVANADLPYVYRELLPRDGEARRLEQQQYSCSTINFLWATDRTFAELPPHLLFLSDDYQANFDAIQRDRTIAQNPSVYIHAPTRLDPSLAPRGQDTLVGIVPVGHIDEARPQDWDDLKQRARRALLARLASVGVTDFEAHLKFEVCFTPPEWRTRYNLFRGATHGLSHNLMQMGYFRPHNRHARYRNLYFAGASTHPGTGLPTALISGRLVAERIVEDWGQA
jgi:phytoene desaturase